MSPAACPTLTRIRRSVEGMLSPYAECERIYCRRLEVTANGGTSRDEVGERAHRSVLNIPSSADIKNPALASIKPHRIANATLPLEKTILNPNCVWRETRPSNPK